MDLVSQKHQKSWLQWFKSHICIIKNKKLFKFFLYLTQPEQTTVSHVVAVRNRSKPNGLKKYAHGPTKFQRVSPPTPFSECSSCKNYSKGFVKGHIIQWKQPCIRNACSIWSWFNSQAVVGIQVHSESMWT